MTEEGFYGIYYSMLGLMDFLRVLITALSAMLVIYFMAFACADFKTAKRTATRMRKLNLYSAIFLGFVIAFSFLIAKPYLADQTQVASKEIKAQTAQFQAKEITDEDYQYLVYALILNDQSMIGKSQRKALEKTMHDGLITVKEFLEIPHTDMPISDEALAEINLNISADDQAKAILMQMVKKETP